ncbi:MAG: hypothetical protein HC869_05010 [Rhodospirillales bacterium]|nr:hypothetical protein [Rhodospirillales bacterium]
MKNFQIVGGIGGSALLDAGLGHAAVTARGGAASHAAAEDVLEDVFETPGICCGAC